MDMSQSWSECFLRKAGCYTNLSVKRRMIENSFLLASTVKPALSWSPGGSDLYLRLPHGLGSNCQPARELRGGAASADAHAQEPLHRQPHRLRHDTLPHLHAVHSGRHPGAPVVPGLDPLQARAAHPGHQHHGLRRHHHSHRLGQVSKERLSVVYCWKR